MKNSRFLLCLSMSAVALLSSCVTPKKKTKKTSTSIENVTSKEVSSHSVASSSISNVSSETISSTQGSSSVISSAHVSISSAPISSASHISSSSRPSSSSQSQPSSSQVTPPEDDYVEIPTLTKRMPAEFEPCELVKMCYPEMMNASVYKEIAKDNKILLLCNKGNFNQSRINEAKQWVSSNQMNEENFTYLDIDLGDDQSYWVRDFSPFYVYNNLDLGVVDFTYNRDRDEQDAVPKQLATYFNMSYSKMNLTHTGGNLMQDGRGTAFSDNLVLQENSNNKTNVCSQMSSYTGTDNYVITIDPQGDYIAHVDCWAKIVAPDKIIVAKLPETNSRYQYYEQVANELGNLKCCYGYNYRIYRVDEPGGSTVAPYTNSLIANKHVYLPLGSNESYNQKAIQVYQDALPGYTIHAINNSSGSLAFKNTDALHCRTHEVPSKKNVFIDSREVLHGEVSSSSKLLVKCNVVSYDKQSLKSVKLYYSINDGAYQSIDMSKYKETSNYTFEFTSLNVGDSVKYYIEAEDGGTKNADPVFEEMDPHSFKIV